MARIWRTGGRKWGWLVGAPAGAGLSVVTSLWLGKLRPRGGQQPALKLHLWPSCFGLFPHTEGLPWQGCHQVGGQQDAGWVCGGSAYHVQLYPDQGRRADPWPSTDAPPGPETSTGCCIWLCGQFGLLSSWLCLPLPLYIFIRLINKIQPCPLPTKSTCYIYSCWKIPCPKPRPLAPPEPRQSPCSASCALSALLPPGSPGQMSSCADRQQSAQVRVRKHPKIPL